LGLANSFSTGTRVSCPVGAGAAAAGPAAGAAVTDAAVSSEIKALKPLPRADLIVREPPEASMGSCFHWQGRWRTASAGSADSEIPARVFHRLQRLCCFCRTRESVCQSWALPPGECCGESPFRTPCPSKYFSLRS